MERSSDDSVSALTGLERVERSRVDANSARKFLNVILASWVSGLLCVAGSLRLATL